MELRELGGALWRQRSLVLLVLLVVAVVCPIGIALAPKTYVATATITAREDPSFPGTDDTDVLRATLAQQATSRSTVAQAIALVGLDRDPDDVRSRVQAAVRPGTVMIDISVGDRAPVAAAAIANAITTVLPDRDVDDAFLQQVVDAAQPPRHWSSPDLPVVIGLALALGALIAAAGAVRRDARSRTVADGAAVEAATSAPLLAHLAAPRDPEALPAMAAGTVDAARFVRLLAALEATTAHRAHRVVVAGVGAADVASWIAGNLAVTVGHGGRRVLLVDARLGRLHPATTTPGPTDDPGTPAPGLAAVLGGLALADAVGPGPMRGVSVLPAGDRGAELSRAWLEDGFAHVMEQAREQADVVVVAAPSLTDADDARVMSAGGLLLMVVPEARLTAVELRAHADRVRAAGGRLAGVVLVGPPTGGRRR